MTAIFRKVSNRVTRILEFSADGKDRGHYRVLMLAIFVGGNQQAASQVERKRDTIRLESRILRAVKAIGIEHPELGGNVCPACKQPLGDERERWSLQEGPQRLELSQEQWEYVDKLLDKVKWPIALSEEAAGLFDWWGSAEKREGE